MSDKKVIVSIKDILCPKCRRIIYAGESWCTYCGEFINPELTYVYSEENSNDEGENN